MANHITILKYEYAKARRRIMKVRQQAKQLSKSLKTKTTSRVKY